MQNCEEPLKKKIETIIDSKISKKLQIECKKLRE